MFRKSTTWFVTPTLQLETHSVVSSPAYMVGNKHRLVRACLCEQRVHHPLITPRNAHGVSPIATRHSKHYDGLGIGTVTGTNHGEILNCTREMSRGEYTCTMQTHRPYKKTLAASIYKSRGEVTCLTLLKRGRVYHVHLAESVQEPEVCVCSSTHDLDRQRRHQSLTNYIIMHSGVVTVAIFTGRAAWTTSARCWEGNQTRYARPLISDTLV